jgi:serine/threonine-protein kinase
MPLDLLRRDEAARAAVFARLMLALSLLGIPLVALFDVDATARAVFAATVAMVAITYSYVLWFSRDVRRYSTQRLGVASQFASLPAAGLLYVFGVYSPAPVVTVLALYALALGGSFRWAFATYASCALGHAALAVAIRAGLADHAMIPAASLSDRNQLLAMSCVQAVYLLAFVQGRWSRAKTVAHLADLELAMRQVAERDALLAEAHRRMDAASVPGQPGRFTGHQLGSFRLGPLLGRGGMGEIYDAIRVGSGEPAAVKLLARHALTEPTKLARFLRELEIARTLTAENVARVLEVGDLEADLPYLAMERLRGLDLDKHLRRHGSLAPAEATELVTQLARGLGAAHAAGIVHRDLKPSNVFRVDGDGGPTWKILDFGVSRLGGDSQLTDDAVVGTPGYMSPEQALGRPVDERTDVYGLAAVAYAALTSATPFGGGTPAVVMARVIKDPVRPPSTLAPLPTAVDEVLIRGLAKAPEDRHASPAELAAALVAALAP